MLDLITDPTILTGLLALIALEIVLGVDNLVFIAVLAEKLPPEQRDKARVIGLSLALVMRLLLLLSIAWIMSLTNPLFSISDKSFSVRDLILIVGGLFLLFKATMELHERIEGRKHVSKGPVAYAGFGIVVTQIVVLDAVFSLDSVITAIGMANDVRVMAIAMIVAMIIMLIASKSLTHFITKRPTLIVLCLGFLLMIGFSLVAEGLGYEVPKGYLYAAIGFSIMVEIFNQLAQHNKQKWLNSVGTLRERTANNILRMLGGNEIFDPDRAAHTRNDTGDAQPSEAEMMFDASEREMIRSVLKLAETNVKALMTHRREVHTIDVTASQAEQREQLLQSPFSRIVAIRDGNLDEPIGIVQKKQLLHTLLRNEEINIGKHVEQPSVLIETQSAVQALEVFRHDGRQIAFIVDEFGILQGIVTLKDILEEIAGDINENDEPHYAPSVMPIAAGMYQVNAGESLHEINRHLPYALPISGDYTTLAGLILEHLEQMPEVGNTLEVGDWLVKITAADAFRIIWAELTLLTPNDTERSYEAN